MNFGRFDTPITITHYVQTGVDEVNQPVGTWETFAEAWAKKDFSTVNETEKNEQIVAQGKNSFITYYVDGVTAKMRIVDNITNQIYRIIGPPKEIGRFNKVLIECEILDNY